MTPQSKMRIYLIMVVVLSTISSFSVEKPLNSIDQPIFSNFGDGLFQYELLITQNDWYTNLTLTPFLTGSGTESDPYMFTGWNFNISNLYLNRAIGIINCSRYIIFDNCKFSQPDPYNPSSWSSLEFGSFVYLENASNVILRNCEFFNMEDTCIEIKSSQNCQIIQCSYSYCDCYCIKTSDTILLEIRENYFSNCLSGFWIKNSSFCTISKCSLTNIRSSALNLVYQGDGNVLESNIFTYCGQGIYLGGSHSWSSSYEKFNAPCNTQINNNIIKFCFHEGIDVQWANDTQISNNTIIFNSESGISLEETKDVVISNNYISYNGEYGIQVLDDVKVSFSDNTLEGNLLGKYDGTNLLTTNSNVNYWLIPIGITICSAILLQIIFKKIKIDPK